MTQTAADSLLLARDLMFDNTSRQMEKIVEENPTKTDTEIALIIWERLYDGMKPDKPDDRTFVGQVELVKMMRTPEYKACMQKKRADRINDATRRLNLAREECAHWDMEADGEGHPCCDEVAEAKEALAKLKKQEG